MRQIAKKKHSQRLPLRVFLFWYNMNYIKQSSKINLEWKVMKGIGNEEEDFSRCKIMLFLMGLNTRYAVSATADAHGLVKATLAENMPEGVYGVELIWIKNDSPAGNIRCISRTRKNCVFGIDANISGNYSVATVRIKSTASSYGYDGLSAYELSVMKGKTMLSEDEWLNKLNMSAPSPDDGNQGTGGAGGCECDCCDWIDLGDEDEGADDENQGGGSGSSEDPLMRLANLEARVASIEGGEGVDETPDKIDSMKEIADALEGLPTDKTLAEVMQQAHRNLQGMVDENGIVHFE